MLPHTAQQALDRRRLREASVLYALYVAPGIVAGAAVVDARGLVATALRAGAFALLIVYLLDAQGERPWRSAGGAVRRFVLGVAILVGLLAVGAAVSAVARQIAGFDSTALGDGVIEITRLQGWWFTPLVVISMVAVGYSEELFFRSYLIHRLIQLRCTGLWAVVFSALLFAIGHIWQGLPGVLYALTAGLALGVVWLRTRDLHLLAWSHAAYNILALVLRLS